MPPQIDTLTRREHAITIFVPLPPFVKFIKKLKYPNSSFKFTYKTLKLNTYKNKNKRKKRKRKREGMAAATH